MYAAAASWGSKSSLSFRVFLRGTIEQSASYKRETPQGECQYVYSGRWGNTLRFHSARPTSLTVSSRSGRLRFSSAVISALSGTLATRGAGVAEAPGCTTVVSDCFQRVDRFRGGRARIGSPRRGVLTVGPLRYRALRRPCGTAESVGGTKAGLELAVGRLTAAQLMNAGRRPIVVTSSYTDSEQLEPPKVTSGTLTTRVSWKLTFTPVQ
jgi:hypothetical protein